jgi:tellurite resistance protein
MVMGLAGLTITWQKASHIYHINQAIYSTLLIQSITVFAIVFLMYLGKSLRYRDALLQEWSHPVSMHFVPAISISLLLFAVIFIPISSAVAQVLWTVGSIVHLLLTIHTINAWMHHEKFEIHHINPAWFIPAVGNVIVPLAGVPLGYFEISWFYFSIGMMFWLILLVIVFNRIVFHNPLPEKLLPTLFILIAPPAVGFLSYLKLIGGVDSFALVLYNFALFLTLLLFSQTPRFFRLPFFMSWWAYSFPLAAMTAASLAMFEISQKLFYGYTGLVLLTVLSVLVGVLFVRTLKAMQHGAICRPEG